MQTADAIATWERLLLESGASAARTRESYRQVLAALAKRIDLAGPPESVTPALVAYRQELQQRFQRGEVSRSLIRLHVSALRSFYRTLVEAKVYAADPTTAIKSIASDEGVPRPLAQSDLDKLFAAIDPSTPDGLRDLALCWLYYHSLRNTEAVALSTKDIAYSAVEDTVVLRFQAKGSKTRLVLLVREAADVLAQHLLAQFGPDGWTTWIPADDTNYWGKTVDVLLTKVLDRTPQRVFTIHERPMTRRDVNRLFQQYCQRAGIRGVPHQLRHSCATTLLNNAVDIRTVQDILGHASLRQTQRYTAVLTSTKNAAMNRLARPGHVPRDS